MTDRLRIPNSLAQRFAEYRIALPALLRRAGLPAGLFQQEKVYLTTAQVFALWRSVGEMSSDPAIGLKLGATPRFEPQHPAAIAVICSRSFGDALQRMARYKKLTCPEEIRIHKKAQETSVEFVWLEAREAPCDVMVDLVMSWISGVGRRGTDGQIKPLRLELTRPAKHRELLESHFNCSVRFKAQRNALVFRSSDLDLPFVTYNEELLAMIGPQLESELKSRNGSVNVGDQVKDTLRRLLAGKRPALQDVAQELGMSARTLQRRLTDAGITFQLLVEETRRELARHYLKQSTVELSEAAFLLGFEDVNSFFRAFHVWEGTSPGEWRARVPRPASL
jgi:AraC-like DNA-binding protein